jgi:hypothetical protein
VKNISDCLITLRIIVWRATHRFFVPLLMSVLCGGTVIACPTCIGAIEHNSPKFFSNDAYSSKYSVQVDHANASIIVEKEEE